MPKASELARRVHDTPPKLLEFAEDVVGTSTGISALAEVRVDLLALSA